MNDRLENLARDLGERAAKRLDVAATAQKVVQRLREEPASPRSTWTLDSWLRIAAALVILMGGAVVLRQAWPSRDSADHIAHLVADDLSDLSTDELRAVLSSFDDLVSGDSVAVPESGNDLRELDAQQLRAVLRSLEG